MGKINDFELLIQKKKDEEYEKLANRAADMVIKYNIGLEHLNKRHAEMLKAVTTLMKAGQAQKLTPKVIAEAEHMPGF